jgi:tetratricopeptide (TPR) repeat protein
LPRSPGRFEQAKSDAQLAARLSARDPEVPNRLINLGMAELGLGDSNAAVVEFQRAIDAGDHSFIPYANLPAAFALQGKTEEAQSTLKEARRLNPSLTVKWLTDHAPHLPRLFDGLRKAGLAVSESQTRREMTAISALSRATSGHKALYVPSSSIITWLKLNAEKA